MRKSIVWAVICLVSAISISGCGDNSTQDSPKPLVKPDGNYILSYSEHMYTPAEGVCNAGPTNSETLTIVSQQNGFTWQEGTLTPVTGTMTCTSDNCVGTVSLQGVLQYYTYTYHVTISSGITGTLTQHSDSILGIIAGCDDTYTVTGTKL